MIRNIVNAIFLRGDCVLLARRSPSKKAYPNLWSFPGGHVEDMETLEQALKREVREELGVELSHFVPLTNLLDPDYDKTPVIYHMFLVQSWFECPRIMDDEHTDLRWFSLGEAENLSDLALQEYRSLFGTLRHKQPKISNPA